MSAVIKNSYGIGTVGYEIRGTEEEVREAIEMILVSFNPCGYGTYFDKPHQVSDVEWLAMGSRYSSCD